MTIFRIMTALLLLALASATPAAVLMSYQVEGHFDDDPHGTGLLGSEFVFSFSLYDDAPYDPFLGVRPRYRLENARVEVPSTGFIGTWSSADFASGYEGHVWIVNDVMYEPPSVIDHYIADFDVAHPAGDFRFEWSALDNDASMLTSDALPLGLGFLSAADDFFAIFTVQLGELGCSDVAQGRCYVYGTSDRVSVVLIPEPPTLGLLAIVLVFAGLPWRKFRAAGLAG